MFQWCVHSQQISFLTVASDEGVALLFGTYGPKRRYASENLSCLHVYKILINQVGLFASLGLADSKWHRMVSLSSE